MKRIIGMILVVVMLTLSLASCGAFNYAESNMTKYASFKGKTEFANALKEIVVEEGDFSADPETRAKKVLDAIYEVLANQGDGDKKKTDAPSDRDVVYYCYYVTADIDGDGNEETVVFTDKMKESSATKLQLGAEYGDDELSAKIAAAIQIKFDGKVYSTTTSSSTKASEGDIAYVTYTVKVGDKEVKETKYTNKKIVIGKPVANGEKATTLESYLAGQKLATNITSLTVGEGESKTVYSDIKINWIFARQTAGKVEEGNKVNVTLTYIEKDSAGKETTKTESKFVTVGDGSALSDYVLGKDIAKLYSSTTDNKIVVDSKEYKSVKIDWRVNETPEAFEIKDTTYDKKTENIKSVDGKEVDLNGVELTYHIYPVYYTDTPEFNATNLVTLILIDSDALLETDDDKKITDENLKEEIKLLRENIYAMLFGEEFSNLDEKNKDDKAKIEERAEKLKNYKFENLSVDDLAEKIIKAYIEMRDHDIAYDSVTEKLTKATEAHEKAEEDLKKAKKALEEAEKDASKTPAEIAEIAKTVKDAEDNEKDKKDALDKVTEEKEAVVKKQEDAKKTKDTYVSNLISIKNSAEGAPDMTLGDEIMKGYRVLVYDSLQESYNEEMKMKFAKEIYFLLTKNIEVTGYPKEAVDDVYEQLMNDYSWDFYNEAHETSTSKAPISNYKYYDGEFDLFLVDQAKKLDSTVKDGNVSEAKKAIRKEAERQVEPLVKLYLASKEYGQMLTDKEFESFKKDYLKNNSANDYINYYFSHNYVYPSSDEVLYGEDYCLLRHAAQLDKLFDWFLEYEEVDVDEKSDKANGYEYKKFDYKKGENDIFEGNYKDGEPASAEKAGEESSTNK